MKTKDEKSAYCNTLYIKINIRCFSLRKSIVLHSLFVILLHYFQINDFHPVVRLWMGI